MEIKEKGGCEGEVVKTLLHDIHLCSGILFENKILMLYRIFYQRHIFVGRYGYNEAQSFDAFYYNNEKLDRAVSTKRW